MHPGHPGNVASPPAVYLQCPPACQGAPSPLGLDQGMPIPGSQICQSRPRTALSRCYVFTGPPYLHPVQLVLVAPLRARVLAADEAGIGDVMHQLIIHVPGGERGWGTQAVDANGGTHTYVTRALARSWEYDAMRCHALTCIANQVNAWRWTVGAMRCHAVPCGAMR